MLTLFKDPFDTFDKFFDTYRYNDTPQINVRKNDGGYKVAVDTIGGIIKKNGMRKIICYVYTTQFTD